MEDSDRCRSGHPAIGEEAIDLADGGGGDVGEHVAQVGEGIDLVTLAGGHKAEENGGSVSAVVGAAEEPVCVRKA